MAIGFVNVSIVSAGAGSSAVGLSAYISRSARQDDITGESYSFSAKGGDLIHSEVMLPKGAPEHFKDGENLWNSAQEAERVFDRKEAQWRWRRGPTIDGVETYAQLAKHVIVALPKELSHDENIELLRRYANDKFVSKGLAVEMGIHSAHDGDVNVHGHILVSLRRTTAEGFEPTKARDLNPGFYRGWVSDKDRWSVDWAVYQNAYFREKGIDLRVDPFAPQPGAHLGKDAMRAQGMAVKAKDALEQFNREAIRDPDKVLDTISRTNAYFTEREIATLLFRRGLEGEEFASVMTRVLGHKDLIPLYNSATGAKTEFFTTRSVRDAEQYAMNAASTLNTRGGFSVPSSTQSRVLARYTLDADQLRAVRAATQDVALSVWRGVAGAGKSYAFQALRDIYQAAGFRVVALGPTNTVANDLARDGFREASTIHSAVFSQEKLENRVFKAPALWDEKTVVLVDEAGMVDTRMMGRLVRLIEASGGKVIFSGDDRQLNSVEFGGLYSEFRDHFGSADLETVRRQIEDWARAASQAFARGNFREGLQAYHDRGHVHAAETAVSAKDMLVAAWREAQAARPDSVKYVYAQTNQDVDSLNAALRHQRVELGQIGAGAEVETTRGKFELAAGDRIQFYGTVKPAGIYNGAAGTVQAISPSGKITARMDAGGLVNFDARTFKDFGLGYAGTVYRAQGKTVVEGFYLHGRFAESRTSMVALTRHKEALDIFYARDQAKDIDSLARQMARNRTRGSSLRFAEKQEAGPIMEAHTFAEVRGHAIRYETSTGHKVEAEAARSVLRNIAERISPAGLKELGKADLLGAHSASLAGDAGAVKASRQPAEKIADDYSKARQSATKAVDAGPAARRVASDRLSQTAINLTAYAAEKAALAILAGTGIALPLVAAIKVFKHVASTMDHVAEAASRQNRSREQSRDQDGGWDV